MKKPTSWKHLDDVEILDEIMLIKRGISQLQQNVKSPLVKERILNEYLDKLKTLYDEQRKRGTFKGD